MSRYTVYITPDTFKDIKKLPGNIRQRIRKAIRDLADNPRPPQSKMLHVRDLEPELWRLRLDNWRIVYGITETDRVVDGQKAPSVGNLLAQIPLIFQAISLFK